jgi:AcrR family transcriptional regulator
VPETVKTDRRATRRAETEARLVEAATSLFVERGYVATTLTDVAERADLAPRTLYLRFSNKAELLRRCIGVAIAGDTDPQPISERDWMFAAMTASTLTDRVTQMAAITATLMARTGPLLDVAQQAAGIEPMIAAAAQAGRKETRRALGEFWQRIADDRLLPRDCDVDWLTETASLLAQADTYLLLTKTTSWNIAEFQAWLETSWLRLVTASAAKPHQR